jgi:hypothetical protein
MTGRAKLLIETDGTVTQPRKGGTKGYSSTSMHMPFVQSFIRLYRLYSALLND